MTHQEQLTALLTKRAVRPGMYWRELKAAPRLLHPDEGLLDVFPAYCGRFSTVPGLLLETTERFVFVALGFLRWRPRTRQARFDEIESASIDMIGGDPRVTLVLNTGKRLRLSRTRPDRAQFPDLIRSLRARIGSRLDASHYVPR